MSLTEAVLNWSSSWFATAAARRLFHCKVHSLLCCLVIGLVPFLSYCFLGGSSLATLFMQDSAPCRAHRAKATRDDRRNVFPDFAVEKTSGSPAAVTKQDRHQFSLFSVERLLRLLTTLWFFCILTCNTFLLSILVSRSINVDFCVHIRECLLTENMYLLWFTSG